MSIDVLTAPSRYENDSFGAVPVAADRYWGAQTERSRLNFPIGHERMPIGIIHALALIKQAAAIVNQRSGALDAKLAKAIADAAAEVASGTFDEHFPLVVWHPDKHERQ